MQKLIVYQVKNNEEWIEKCIEGVTGETKALRTLIKLVPTMLSLALAGEVLNLTKKTFDDKKM